MLRLSEHVRAAHTQDGSVLLDVERGRMFSLNPTGSRVVELLKPGVDESEIAPLLAREFGIDFQTAAKDLAEFLSMLERHALVTSH